MAEPSSPDAPEPDGPADDPTDQPDAPKADDTDWKGMARKHEREAKKLRTELAAAQQASETANETAIRLAREEAEQAVRNEVGPELTTARLELAILKSDDAKKLADPTDAIAFIDAKSVQDDDGTVDPKKLGAAIDALLTAKPHLAAGHKPPPPRVPGGPRSDSETPSDMNQRLRQAAGYR